MKNFNIGKVEDTNITLDTVLGLGKTVNDLLVNGGMQVITNSTSTSEADIKNADRLADKLLALSNAIISTTEQAQEQINNVVHNYYHREK
ncbi:hypothetical protein [Limosilactobacillus coleohominis]|uniref:hypothetical protein n=1 Tax=Limosilactobacillus coleohominis TaxID=181675 RepID=UPI002A91B691|nr:hypothetical protein [Limosilactobacillus coleohominis]MDY5628903.1 hypothetical protein [Limosilactobacillus coleohominis]